MTEPAERLIDLAARKSHAAERAAIARNANRWTEARAAYGIVGMNRRGLTQRLAENIVRWDARARKWEPVSVDTVEHLAHAYELFVFMMQHLPAGQDSRAARNLRRAHGVNRFAALWHVWRKYEVDPERLYSALELDMSIAGMLATVEAAEHPLTEGQRRVRMIAALANKVTTDLDIPDSIRKLAAAFRYEWEQWQAGQL